jgi:hypothetical protein
MCTVSTCQQPSHFKGLCVKHFTSWNRRVEYASAQFVACKARLDAIMSEVGESSADVERRLAFHPDPDDQPL